MKLGIYGGSFSPPHIGHIKAAEEFISETKLDKLLIMPALLPPHKLLNDGADTCERAEMCRLAFGNIPKCEISTYEIDKGGISYTYETLEHFKNEGTELFILCGTDMFMSLSEWKCPDIIFSLATVVGIRRDGVGLSEMFEAGEKYRVEYGADVAVLGGEPIEVSSTEVRSAIKLGLNTKGLLPDAVSDYIRKKKLYL